MSTTDDHAPVQDWATDFDHTDEAYAADPFPIWDEIRASECPVAHTERYGGAWLPTSHADVVGDRLRHRALHVAQHPDVATSGRRSSWRPPGSPRPSPPTRRSTTAPGACSCRRSPRRRSTSSRPSTRDYCKELIAEMGDRDVVDAAKEYAQHIPVRVIARMLGFPEEDADRFRGFVHHVLEGVALPLEEREEGMIVLFEYLEAQVARPRREPARRPHHLPPGRRAGRRAARAWTTSAARWPCCSSPASTRRGAPSARRSATSPSTPADRRAAGRRARAAPDRHGGAPPCLRPRDHGPPGSRGHGLPRLPDEGRRLGAAPVPGGQPRPATRSRTPTR